MLWGRYIKPEVAFQCLSDRFKHVAGGHAHVMSITVVSDVQQEVLKTVDVSHPPAPKEVVRYGV